MSPEKASKYIPALYFVRLAMSDKPTKAICHEKQPHRRGKIVAFSRKKLLHTYRTPLRAKRREKNKKNSLKPAEAS